MPQNEGLVTTLKGDGKAEVVIQPVSSGIPGASRRVNRHVCHCATNGSTITFEALNRVGADIGDVVSVSRDTSGLVKNAAVLLGIPGICLMIGITLATILYHVFVFPMIGGVGVAAGCLLIGIFLGVLLFRRMATDNLPVIDRIVRTRVEAASGHDENAFCIGPDQRTCNGCSGPFR